MAPRPWIARKGFSQTKQIAIRTPAQPARKGYGVILGQGGRGGGEGSNDGYDWETSSDYKVFFPGGLTSQGAPKFTGWNLWLDTFRKNAFVSSCVRLIAECLLAGGSRMVPTVEGSKPSTVGRDLVEGFLENFHPYYTIEEFLRAEFENLALASRDYIEVVPNQLGQPAAMFDLPQGTILPCPNKSGMFDKGRAFIQVLKNEDHPVEFSWDRVLWLRLPGMRGQSVNPLSPIELLSLPTGSTMEAERYIHSYFSSGGKMGFILTNKNWDKAQATEWLRYYQRQYTDSGHGHKPLVLYDGTEIEAPPKALGEFAQFLDIQRFDGRKVSGVFGVDPRLIGYPGEGALGGTEREQVMQELFVNNINPKKSVISQIFNRQIVVQGFGVTDWRWELVPFRTTMDAAARKVIADTYGVLKDRGFINTGKLEDLQRVRQQVDGELAEVTEQELADWPQPSAAPAAPFGPPSAPLQIESRPAPKPDQPVEPVDDDEDEDEGEERDEPNRDELGRFSASDQAAVALVSKHPAFGPATKGMTAEGKVKFATAMSTHPEIVAMKAAEEGHSTDAAKAGGVVHHEKISADEMATGGAPRDVVIEEAKGHAAKAHSLLKQAAHYLAKADKLAKATGFGLEGKDDEEGEDAFDHSDAIEEMMTAVKTGMSAKHDKGLRSEDERYNPYHHEAGQFTSPHEAAKHVAPDGTVSHLKLQPTTHGPSAPFGGSVEHGAGPCGAKNHGVAESWITGQKWATGAALREALHALLTTGDQSAHPAATHRLKRLYAAVRPDDDDGCVAERIVDVYGAAQKRDEVANGCCLDDRAAVPPGRKHADEWAEKTAKSLTKPLLGVLAKSRATLAAIFAGSGSDASKIKAMKAANLLPGGGDVRASFRKAAKSLIGESKKIASDEIKAAAQKRADPPAKKDQQKDGEIEAKFGDVDDYLDAFGINHFDDMYESIVTKQRDVFLEGIREGWDQKTLVDTLEEKTEDYSEAVLNTVARTSSGDFYGWARHTAGKESGIVTYYWRSEINDERTAPVCQVLNGIQVAADRKEVEILSGSLHFNCRGNLSYGFDENFSTDEDRLAEGIAMIDPAFK